jgi:hypothetical protein
MVKEKQPAFTSLETAPKKSSNDTTLNTEQEKQHHFIS